MQDYISASLSIYNMIKEKGKQCLHLINASLITFQKMKLFIIFKSLKNSNPTYSKIIFIEFVLLYFILSI